MFRVSEVGIHKTSMLRFLKQEPHVPPSLAQLFRAQIYPITAVLRCRPKSVFEAQPKQKKNCSETNIP